jgi:proteasome accessory factor C
MTGQPAHPPARVSTSSDRLQRLLALVPYVVSRKVVGLGETAAAFGVSERELVDDLNMLWCVELRAPDPYCPIDLSYEGGEIEISQAESMDRPLRLGVDEASALLVALRMLAEVGQVAPAPSLAEGSALSRTIAKLEAAAGEAAAPSAQVAVQVDRHAERSVAAQLREALAAGRRVHLSYYVPGRDEATERDVDPMRLLVVEGRTYRGGALVPARPGARGEGAHGGGPGAAGGGARRPRQRPVPALAHRSAGGDRALAVRALGGGVLPVRGSDGTG